VFTFRRPSVTPARTSTNSITRFRSTGAWGLIPPTATPTSATTSPSNGPVPAGPTARLLEPFRQITSADETNAIVAAGATSTHTSRTDRDNSPNCPEPLPGDA